MPGWQTQSGGRLLLRILSVWMAVVFALQAECPAQSEPMSPSAAVAKSPEAQKPASFAPTESPPSQPAAIPAADSDVIELLGPDGNIVQIPRSATFAEFQKWLKSREAKIGPTAPEFSVSSVTFEGSTEPNEESATLDVTLTITIAAEGRDVLVPLHLNDATLLKKPIHTGPGLEQFEQFDRELGFRCWLRGRGQHELKLSLSVPIRRQGSARRLQLRLPETPASSIKLTVPLARISAKGIERGFVRTTVNPKGGTDIESFFPPNSLLDLSWQPLTELSETKPELQARTFIAAELRAESLALEATQIVAATQGTFDKLSIRLPAAFELHDVTGREVKEYSVTERARTKVDVTLTAPTQGPIELKWVLSARIAPNAVKLPLIEGFDIEGTRKQSGHIAVTTWEGVNLKKQASEERFVERDTLASIRDLPGLRPVTSANGNTTVYRFLKQPFRLPLEVQKVEPYFSTEQTHLLRLSAQRADLETTLAMRVFRGSLIEFFLDWPSFKAEGWESISTETPELVEQVLVEETPAGSRLKIRLVDYKVRGDQRFEIRLKASRPIPSDGREFPLSLPAVAASGQEASMIIVAPSANLEVDWQPLDEVAARPATPDEALLDQLESTRNVTAWRWSSGVPRFTASAKVQQQTIQIESLSDLKFDSRGVTVEQHIAYQVSFEPLAQVRLMVPRSISDRVRFQLVDATGQTKPLLAPIYTALEIDQAKQCRLPLDQPQVGRFEVIATFELERALDSSGDEPTLVNVPVVHSSDAEFTATRVKWETGERLTASVDDTAWKPELGNDKTSQWRAIGLKNTIAIHVVPAGQSVSQDFTVHRALIQTTISDGQWSTRGLFELDRDVREVLLTLPEEIAVERLHAWWNGSSIPVEVLSGSGSKPPVEVRLRKPKALSRRIEQDTEAADHTKLWLEFYSQQAPRLSWRNEHELVVPSFASTVWIAQSIWQVVLPPDQHLLTAPRDFAAHYHWQRSLLLWSRQPNEGFDRIERVLADAAPVSESSPETWNAPPAFAGLGNAYPLSCFGGPKRLVFWSMSRSAIVGCGAGFSLLLGFLLIRIPATRHILTFLVVTFTVSMSALWFAEPVKVLLQPAVLGTAMAIVAALIDRAGRSTDAPPLVVLSSPSDFIGGTGSGVRRSGPALLAEGSTAPPPPLVSADTGLNSRSGVHE
jgi:hypothetical protein